jgi:hypothetical protein
VIYSVWNNGAFDYFETPEIGPTHAPARHTRASSALGASPCQAAWKLPAGARRVGRGAEARGRIASSSSSCALGALELGGSRGMIVIGGLVLAALLARKHLR